MKEKAQDKNPEFRITCVYTLTVADIVQGVFRRTTLFDCLRGAELGLPVTRSALRELSDELAVDLGVTSAYDDVVFAKRVKGEAESGSRLVRDADAMYGLRLFSERRGRGRVVDFVAHAVLNLLPMEKRTPQELRTVNPSAFGFDFENITLNDYAYGEKRGITEH